MRSEYICKLMIKAGFRQKFGKFDDLYYYKRWQEKGYTDYNVTLTEGDLKRVVNLEKYIERIERAAAYHFYLQEKEEKLKK